MNQEEKIQEVLTRGVEMIYPDRDTFEKALRSGQRLTIYQGIDPSGPTLHLGHLVPLLKLRQLQQLGHKIVVLIGNFTAQIGDPTDKSATRVPLTKKQVMQNCKQYKKQISRVLDLKKTKFVYNSKWLEKMKFADVIELASEFTVQRLLERDMFEKRMTEGRPIHLHEFLYPIMQGYDSVALDVDMEVGGNDQTYNMLAGRTLLKSLKNKEKFVLTTKLLVDSTGKKMGKTEGNMVSLADGPDEMYGKVMSWPDELIVLGFEIISDTSLAEIEQVKQELAAGGNPKKAKMLLAYNVVRFHHGVEKAIAAEENFKHIFEEGLNPDQMAIFHIVERGLLDVLVATKLAESKSEARRLIQQGGIRVDTRVIKDENFVIGDIGPNGTVIQKGKRHFIKIMETKK